MPNLENIGRIIADALNKEYRSKDIQSNITFRVKDDKIELIGENYLAIISSGRARGVFPNVSRLREWVAFQNIQWQYEGRILSDDQITYILGRSIARDGIKGKEIISSAINKNIGKISENMTDVFYEAYLDMICKKVDE